MEAQTLVCLLLLPGILAGPLSWDERSVRFQTKCSSHCTGSGKFQYQIGKTYQYRYETTTIGDVHGASEGKARLETSATAYIHVLSKCELALTLSDVSVKRSEPNTDAMKDVMTDGYRATLESNVLHFSYQDGRVDEICSSDNEEPITVNFKRGVLSAFQNSMSQHNKPETLNEIGVTGNCPTTYSISQRGTKTLHISKTKDLLGCSDRYYYRTSLQSTPFHTPNAIKSLPLLKGSHKCTQTVSRRDNIISKTLCIESLVFRPFSKQEAGARTETTQKLEHIKTVTGHNIQIDGVLRRSSLLFDHTKSKSDMDQKLWASKQKLNQLCRASIDDISANVPALFADLVYIMRGLDSQDIMSIWERVERGTVCGNNLDRALKFILDSLPMVGTSASVEVMTNMLLANSVKDTEAKLWITSFTFIQDPDKSMIEQLQRLLLSEVHRKHSLLPVTSLINNFCRMHTDCMSISSVIDTIDILNDILGMNCQDADQDLILTTLRAISNVGYADQLVPVLEKCFSLSTNDMVTRVMAAQAFRGVTCNAKRDGLLELFRNDGEDSELRIAAYLSLMKCPNPTLLQMIRISLDSESVSQVGSFVWTHLTNLMESSSPHKQSVREILEDEKLQKEYDMDKRKYSRNYEWSYFSEKFGTGAMAESNLVWSSSSFLPRSLMVNLTVDVLGHSVNLLEAGARTQGMESFLMNYFGRNGIFAKKDKSAKFNNPSRCVKKSKMNDMHEKHSVSESEMSASLFLRMFGNDLQFKHFNEKDIMEVKSKLNAKDILASLAKGDKISFSHSSMFLDTTVCVPTIGGMALELSVNGTASVEITANGKMNLHTLSMKNLAMSFNVKPSGAVQLAGLMTVNAGVTKTGVRIVTTMHSSTAFSGSLDLKNGEIFSASIDTPKDKLEVMDVKSEIFVVHDDIEEKQMMKKFKTFKEKVCTQKSLLKVMGYESCTEYIFVDTLRDKTAPYYPLTGPSSFNVIIHKKDAPRGLKLTAKYIKNDNSYTGHVSFSTPGSNEDRNVAAGYYINTKDRSLEIELTSPWKKLLLKGAYVVNANTRSMQGTFVNDGREYALEIKSVKQEETSRTIWIPSIRILRPADSSLAQYVRKLPEKFAANGRIVIDNKFEEIAAEVNVSSGVKPDPITFRANFTNKKMEKNVAVTVTLNKRQSYAATFQALVYYSGKKLFPSRIQPTIMITMPSYRLFLLYGSIDYRARKLLKTDLTVKMDKHLKTPMKIFFKTIKSNKKGLAFKGNAKLISEFAVVKSKGVVTIGNSDKEKKSSSLFSSRIATSYVLPNVKSKKLKKNTVVLNLKVNDRSTTSITKYYASMNLDSKKYQDASFLTTLDFAHKATYTKSMLTFRHNPKAKNMKDKTNALKIGGSISHKISKKGVDIRYDFSTIYPVKKIDCHWKGKHEHNLGKPFGFESYNMVVLSKGKTIELRLKGQDRSKKLLEAHGNMELNYPSLSIGKKTFEGQNYKLTTIIKQTSEKEYVHTVNVQTKEGVKHVMVTSFRKSRNNNFNLKSEVEINGEHKSRATVMAMMENEVVDASVLFEKDNEMYKGEMTFENIKDTYKAFKLDVLYPERRITAVIEGGKNEGKNIMRGSCSWDADKDITKKLELNLMTKLDGDIDKIHDNEMELIYSFKVATPFENHLLYQLERTVIHGPQKFYDEYSLILGTPQNEYYYKFSTNLPLTAERIEMLFQLKTPFEVLRNFRSEIRHKLDGSKFLTSNMGLQYNENEISMTFKIVNTGNLVNNQLESSFKIESSFPKYKTLTLKFSHADNGRAYKSSFTYEKNDEKYTINLDSEYFRIHWQVKLYSSLQILLHDGNQIIIVLDHDNSLTNLRSTLTGKWWNSNQSKLIINSKFNKAEKDYDIDINYSSTLKEFHSLILKSHYNEMNGKQGSFFSEVNNNPLTTYNYKYKYTDTEMSFDGSDTHGSYNAVIKYERYPVTVFVKYSLNGEYQKDYVLDASIDKSHDSWTTDLRLLTPFEEARNIAVKGHLKKKNQLWILDGQIFPDVKKQIKLDFSIDTDQWTLLNGQIISPYKKMTFMKFGYDGIKGKGTYNSTVFIEMQPVFNMVKMNNFISDTSNFNMDFTLEVPDLKFKYIKIKADNIKQRRGGKTNINIKYHPNKEIDLKLKARYNKNKFPDKTRIYLDFSSPYEILRTLNMNSIIEKNNNGRWEASLSMKTSNKQFESLDAQYGLTNSKTGVDTYISIDYPQFGPIYSGLLLDWGEKTAHANFTMVTPQTGRTMLGFKRKATSWLDFQNKIFGEFKGNELDMDIGLKHDELSTKVWLTYMYPGADQSFIKTNIFREGNSFKDFDVGSFFQIGKDSPEYNTSVQFSLTDNKFSLGLTCITPHTVPFSYLVKLVRSTEEGIEREITCYLMFGKDYLADLFEKVKGTSSYVDYEYRGNYLIEGKGHKAGTHLIAKWDDDGEELDMTNFYDDTQFQLEGAHRNAKANGNNKDTFDIMVYTPYKSFKDVGLHAYVQFGDRYYNGKCTVEYMDDKEAELHFDISEKNYNHLSVDATLTIPETEYKTNTFKYTQVKGEEQLTSDVSIILGNGDQASGKVQLKNTEEFIITVTGPIKQFEKLTVTGKYNEKQQRLNGDIQLKLTLHPKPANLEFDIFINNEPVQINFKLRSPYENFKYSKLSITHTGKDWKRFVTRSKLTSDAIGKMNSEISFNYNSETEMEIKAILTSTVENMENLKFGFNTKKQQDKHLSHVEVGWDVDKEIIIDSTWTMNRDKTNTVFETSSEISTPFVEFKSAVFKISHQNGKKYMNEYIKIGHNGNTYLDSTLSYQIGKRHIGSIDIRYPRPMAFDLEAEVGDQTFDGKLKLNWDKHSPESLFEFVTKMSDKSMDSVYMDKAFSFKVIHPVRVMGLDGQIKCADKEILSSGHVTWDERKGKTFSYDIGYSDRSTKYSEMYDGHVKVGVPQRSVKVEGSHRDTGSSKTLSSSIFWDADKDETKKVVLSTTTEHKDRMERVSLNLNLPYINKQMNMGISRKVGYGSSILESKAEISYSSDPRKNIVITTKIDNTELDYDGLGNFNYTMDVVFVHQITGINIRVSNLSFKMWVPVGINTIVLEEVGISEIEAILLKSQMKWSGQTPEWATISYPKSYFMTKCLQWESHLSQVNEISSTGSRITYLTANKDKKVFAFWSQHDATQKKGEMMIMTPLKTVALIGDIDHVRRLHLLKFHVLEDGKEALKIVTAIAPERRNMEVEIDYDRNNANKIISISGNFVGDSALQINVVSQDGSKIMSESQIAVTLNSSQILHTRIQWQPNLFKDIQTYLSTEAAILSHMASDAFKQTLKVIGEEVQNKYARVSQELRDETKQVFELMEKEMDGFSTQLESLRTAYRRFYQNNNLGIRKMGDTMNAAFVGLSKTIQDLVKQYRTYYTGITKATNKWLIELRTYPVMQKYLAASKEFIDALKKSRVIIEGVIEDVANELEKVSALSYKIYSGLQRNIDRKFNSYNHMVHSLPKYKQMMAQRQFKTDSGEQKIPEWLGWYEWLYLNYQEMLQDQYEDLMRRKEFREMYAVGAEIHQQLMYYSMEPNLESAFKSVVDLGKNLILMEIMKIKDDFMNVGKSRLIVYDPEGGELQFEIHLPMELKSLVEPPKVNLKVLSKIRSLAQIKAPLSNHSIWDYYYKYVPSLKPADLIPPFEASGYVIGPQHILTFDKTHYDFASTCSHVLARDLLHDSFSVVLNYNRNNRQKQIKSICLHFEDSHSLEISSNYELTVNNKETEMPYNSNIVSVIREGDLITVKYVGGLMVVCNPQLDIYKVTISGWYHGLTAGLLGFYDNEKKNDESLLNMVRDFEVNRRTCKTTKNLAVPLNSDNDKNNICVKLFEDNSSKFRPCFKQVEPSNFLKICQHYLSYMTTEDAVHKVTEQYRFVCRDNGVFIGPLDDYVPCNKEDPIIVEGKDPLYHSADIMFVVQDNKCNDWASSSLAQMVTEINQALNSADMKNNRFGLLGVRDMNPTARTMNGQFFGPAADFLRAVETFKFPEENSLIDLSETIRMAMKYPYRVGVAKVLIIAPCNTCEVGFMQRNLDSALKYNGFSVHILRQQATSMQDIIQVNDIKSRVTNKVPSVGQISYNYPYDYCNNLAGTTQGNIFDIMQLKNGNDQMQRKLIKSIAQKMGWETKLPACQKCQCNVETGLTECKLCESNSIVDYVLLKTPSLHEVFGKFHDLKHVVMSQMSK